MEVLTFMDVDGHMHAFDISTPEKKKKVVFSILQLNLDHKRIYTQEDGQRALDTEDLELAIELINESDGVGFERSGGHRMYMVKIEDTWNISSGDFFL